jgi:hypothetical protein
MEKSDLPLVARKRANKAASGSDNVPEVESLLLSAPQPNQR